MKRRNFLRNITLFIFAFIFGYTVKKEGENMILQRFDSSQVKNENGQWIEDEIKVLSSQSEKTIEDVNKVSEKLNETSNKFVYVSIKDFPRLSPEIEDAARINRAINSIDEGIIILHNDIYITKTPIKIKSNVTLQGQNPFKTIIQNNAGTNIIETLNTSVRYYSIQVNNITLDGVNRGNQTGLNIPHVSNLISRNLVIRNVKIGIYQNAKLSNGTITGAYYNSFYNPNISKTEVCIHFDELANENTIFGGKLFSSDNGAIISSNSVKVFGTSFETNKKYHLKIFGYNNSFYGIRMEGLPSCKGILNDPLHKDYPNYFYSPHFQALSVDIEDRTNTLMVIHEKGIRIPVRTHATILESTRKASGSLPMVNMMDTNRSSGIPVIYRSQMSCITGRHLEGVKEDGKTSVYEVNYYGEFECKTPGKGIVLASPDGSRYSIQVNNSGVISTTKI